MANIRTKFLPSFDPFDVKKDLVDLAEDYFQVGNLDVYESGFLGYLIQSLTLLTSNTLYQNAMAYNEAFLNRAILPASVLEIAAQLDYNVKKTTPASGFLTVIVPIPNNEDLLVKIPASAAVFAGDIPYKVRNSYYIEKNETGIFVTTQNLDTGMVMNVPYTLELREGVLSLVFSVEIWQIDIYYHEFNFENPTLYVFYEENVSGYEGQIYNVLVNVDGEIYKQLVSIYQAKTDDRCYEMKVDNITPTLNIKFGNGIYGYLPKNGAAALVTVYTTLGSDGNIVANSAVLTERIVDNISGKQITVDSYNPYAITNGLNSESIEDIKRHTRENISAAKRLVTEQDFKNFQGVTGLTNFSALPVLNRRDIVGNDISLFTVLYDTENKPIPAASVPVGISPNYPIIPQGSTIIYNGTNYKTPFRLELDTTYEISRVKYYYSLHTITVPPFLFSTGNITDILMGLRQIQAKIQEHDNKISFVCDIHKLATMDGSKIAGVLKIDGLNNIQLQYNNTYEDKVTVNISSDIISSNDFPTESFVWTVDLYYDNEIYNTYKGEWTLFNRGIPVDETVYSLASPLYPNTFLQVYSITFKTLTNSDNGYFTIPVEKMAPVDSYGNDILPENIQVTIHISGNTYSTTFSGIANNTLTFNTQFINLNDIDVGETPWQVEVQYKATISFTTYNIYTGEITILDSGKRPIRLINNDQPSIVEEPKIPLIHLGLNHIVVTTNSNGDYIFATNISKMPHNNSQYIGCTLLLEHDLINMQPIDMVFSGETQENEEEATESNTPTSTVTFISAPISSSAIPLGSVTFKIELSYDGEIYSVYKQNAIFHQDMTQICYSNVSGQMIEGEYKAWNVPVIEAEYYDANISYLDQYVFNVLATLKEKFHSYKMLTDRINIKFAKTFGASINMRLNRFNPTPAKLYPAQYYNNIIPDIKVKVYIPQRARNSIVAIVEECQNVLYTFLQLKANYHTNIYRSEIARFLHDAVDDIEFCEVITPADDIVYNFNLEDIPRSERMEIFLYCPEFIWFDKNKIVIDTVLMS